VLTPKGQKEITETVAALRRFHPTKIAIEAPLGRTRVCEPGGGCKMPSQPRA